ncbi:hypothetical protein [Hymenobacter edaphi]|uniref:Uncharacterized protein n=1 Tax=Hymenobacter edaphi TaxID=2211146 RepID=A0A328BBI3_9BACT|nr:hypothetical protein [Hymenobacter edaphi]RAK63196.1 hypothetical protein DLM85_21660 [Hymenobacter edaphi]
MLLGATGCKKDPLKTLPKATQEGKNTMGCLVDGKAWTPQGSSGCLTGCGAVEPIFARWRRLRTNGLGGGFTLSFDRIKKDETQSYLSFFAPRLVQASTVALDQAADPFLNGSNPAYGRYIHYSSLPYPDYRTGPDASGTLILTRFDTVACIAAGTFSFTGRHAASGQTVQVTEGRFDVRFAKQ